MGVEGKLRYEARIKAVNEGGTITTNGVDLMVSKADAVTLYFAAATNFVNYKDVSGNPHQRVEDCFNKLGNKPFSSILNEAVIDHRGYFNRVSLKLPVSPQSYLPVTERIKRIQSAPDPAISPLS